jgi:2-methylcitrate dehydratase PrpD
MLPALSAGFVSAVHASALDYDDGHYRGGAIHPSSVIVPSLLVAASQTDPSAEEFAVAQVAAYEVAVRLAHLLWPQPGGRWHCTATAASVGAAVGIARLLGMDAEGIKRVLMTAWSHAPQSALHLPMSKEAIGWAGGVAVHSAFLVNSGWMRPTGAGTPPNAPAIFPPTPFDEPHTADDGFVNSVGRAYEIERSYLKPYPACRYTHTAIDVLGELLEEGLPPQEIETIQVRTHAWATFLDYKTPVSLEHAQYSYPFVLAVRALRGRVSPLTINEDALFAPDLLEFASRVEVVYDQDLDELLPDHYPTRLTLRMRSGQVVDSATRAVARGDVEDPLSDDFLEDKFLEMASRGLGDQASELLGVLRSNGRPRLILDLLSRSPGTSR